MRSGWSGGGISSTLIDIKEGAGRCAIASKLFRSTFLRGYDEQATVFGADCGFRMSIRR
jgi:hypothetical protein